MVFFGLAVAIGGLIGLYWSVFALVPVTIIMFLGCCAVTVANGDPALTALFSTLIAAFGLQLGYLIGLMKRDSVGHFISRFNAAPSKRI